jgi:hypothetical protein
MKKTAGDHALAVIKAGLNAVPVVGGSIASLIGDYILTATQKTIERTLDTIRAQVEQLGDRIDPESVNRDEFSELFKSSYLVIARTHHEAKLRAAAALVVNILLRKGDPDKLSYTELNHYARCLDQLSSGAVEVLAHAVRVAESVAPGRLAESSVSITFNDIRGQALQIAPSLLMGLLGELDAHNLVHRAGVPTIRTADYGNYLLEVTPLGGRFAKHLLAVA